MFTTPAFAKPPTSCPLGTQVAPFGVTALGRYTITVSDGGEGDLDGAVDGRCTIDLSVCGRHDDCGPATPAAATVDVTGKLGAIDRAALRDTIQQALDAVTADASTPACRPTRITVPAAPGARAGTLSIRVVTTVDGQKPGAPHVRRARVGIRCTAADATPRSARCDAPKGRCPASAGLTCGDGVRGGSEACDGADAARCGGTCRPDCSCQLAPSATNVAPRAVVTASSARRKQPASATVDGGVGPEHEWIARDRKDPAVLRLAWPSPVTVDRVVLHDLASDVDNVREAHLIFDDGSAIAIGALPADGRGHQVTFGARALLGLTLAITQASSAEVGLGEIQVLAAADGPVVPVDPHDPGGPSDPGDPTMPGGSDTPPVARGTTYYLSPSGSDGNAGTSAAAPWKTFGKVLRAGGPLRPGDGIVLLDGRYTRETTGLPNLDCRSGGNAPNGTSDAPILLRAQNERRAHLAGNGSADTLQMRGCKHWRVWGLYGTSADNRAAGSADGNVFQFVESADLTLSRLLAVRPNRTCPNGSLSYCNSHAIAIEKSERVLVEDAEAYDFHRHGISVFASKHVTVRRAFLDARDAPGAGGGPTGIIFYGASDSIVENSIAQRTVGINIAGTKVFDGTPGGYRNRLLGVVTLDNTYGATIRARRFGGPVLPVGDNVVRDSVFARTKNVGVYARGASNTLLENVTILGTSVDAGIAADEDRGEKAYCSGNPQGCSITMRNVLSVQNGGKGARVDGSVVKSWMVEHSVFAGNRGGDFPTSERADDAAGSVRQSSAAMPSGIGLGAGQCLLWAADGSALRGAGKSGAAVGATVLYRYRNGTLTKERLWDPQTGAFPCGARVAGVNDVPGRSCFDVHRRLNVNTNGCRFPAGY